MVVKEFVTESVCLQRPAQEIIISVSEGARDGVRFELWAVTETGSEEVCDGVCFQLHASTKSNQ